MAKKAANVKTEANGEADALEQKLSLLMRDGPEPVDRHDLSSLRLLGTVGEPINPEAWLWYHRHVGKSKLPIVDTWWQTETGGAMMTPLPGAHALKPGAAAMPFYGIVPALVDAEGKFIAGPEGQNPGPNEGNLVLTRSWPGQARTVYGDHERFTQTYFTTYRGLYFTGDGARRDADPSLSLRPARVTLQGRDLWRVHDGDAELGDLVETVLDRTGYRRELEASSDPQDQARLAEVHIVTLAPPLARAACAISPKLYTLLNTVPWLRTHKLIWLSKPA